VITRVIRQADGHWLVRGTTADDGPVKAVRVNGVAARPVRPDFAEWEVVVAPSGDGRVTLTASAEDVAGNVEPRPHSLRVGGADDVARDPDRSERAG
jgi:hypothetical protein